MLGWIDKLAGRWLDYRMRGRIQSDVRLKEFSQKDNETRIWLTAPGIVDLADQCAALLDEYHAQNYLEFKMLPRLDRGVFPMVVTVMRQNGVTPGEKAAGLVRVVRQAHECLQNHCPIQAQEVLGEAIQALELE